MIRFELKAVPAFTPAESAAFRAAQPAEAAAIDARMAAVRADLVALYGEAIAESIMPTKRQAG